MAPVRGANGRRDCGSRSGANDNKSAPQPQSPIVPETDVERFYKEKIESQDDSSVTATQLYEDYCTWCEDEAEGASLRSPRSGVSSVSLGSRRNASQDAARYIGIALKTDGEYEEDMEAAGLRH